MTLSNRNRLKLIAIPLFACLIMIILHRNGPKRIAQCQTAANERCKMKQIIEANAQIKLTERRYWFDQSTNLLERRLFRNAANNNHQSAVLFSPYYPCLFTLERTSSKIDQFDGGKWVCGVKELEHKSTCRVYSFGSNFDRSFEDFVNNRTQGKCEIHIYDPTMDENPSYLNDWLSKLPKNYHFHKFALGKSGEHRFIDGKFYPSISIREAMEKNGDSEEIDILKFDAEGSEYGVLENMDWNKVKIGMVLFELHTNIISSKIGKVYTMLKFEEHISKMERAGYRMYSTDPACKGCAGQTEIAMIHKDWIPAKGFQSCCV